MKQTTKNQVEVTRNAFEDSGDGIISFPNGLNISDDQYQRNGTKYDINTLDITKYAGQLTADHEDKLRNIIGRVEGVKKNDGSVTVDRIVYAVKQNPYARLAYDLLIGGFSKAFSTETIGPLPDERDGTLYNHELVGLSQVVTPNNYSAQINQVIHNSLEKSKNEGLEIDGIEEKILNSVKKETKMTKVNNEAEQPVEEVVVAPEVETTEVEETKEEIVETPAEEVVEVENAAEVEAEAEEKVEEETTEEAEVVEESEAEEKVEEVKNEISDKQVTELFARLDQMSEMLSKLSDVETEDKPEETVEEIVAEDANNEVESEEKTENKNNEDETMTKEEMQNAIADALKGYFANDAKAPEFKKAENALGDLDWKERYNKQVNAAYEALRLGDVAARETLNEINKINLNALKEAGIAKNAMTISSMGNFVIPPEMYKEIVGKRTDFTAILNATDWRETNSLEFAWLQRNGDIDMQNIAMCDDGANGNLKPISEYTATPKTGKMEEMAAVTVVCNAATRFFAVDLLADVAQGYRNDYDRKRAQLVIAKLQEAVEANGNSTLYAPETDTAALTVWLQAMAEISDTTTNGTLIFNNKTFAQLKAHALEAGVNGPLSQLFVDGEIPTIFGTPYIVVPNELMPAIEGTDEVVFTVEGEEVEITHAVFYADLSEFVGYTSGGLQYDISADASYEVAGGTVRSAYQRNELVLRGSFFRGGAVKDATRVAGIVREGLTS